MMERKSLSTSHKETDVLPVSELPNSSLFFSPSFLLLRIILYGVKYSLLSLGQLPMLCPLIPCLLAAVVVEWEKEIS